MKNIFSLFLVVFIFLAFKPELFAQTASDIQLPAPCKIGRMSVMEALSLRSSSRDFSSEELPLPMLSDLLWAADGINRTDGKRTAATSYNTLDMDVYIALRSGIYFYNPQTYKLELIKSGNYMSKTGTQSYVADAALNLIYVCNLSKISGSSEAEKLLVAGIHTGLISQNVYLYCASVGLNTVVRSSVDISTLGTIMGLNTTQRVILCQTVGFKP